MRTTKAEQERISLGTHGEGYGNWMSNPVFYILGGITILAAALTVISFAVFRVTAAGAVCAVITAALLGLLGWITWIRRQYAFGGGGIMEQVHRTVLSHLDSQREGSMLEVGGGSGALSIRAALTWPETRAMGVDYWGAGGDRRPRERADLLRAADL